MKKSVVVVGVGEIGSVFARGFLRCGYPVVPVTRNMSMSEVADDVPDPELVVIAVGEADLHAMLSTVPECWKDRLVLIQNELLSSDWAQYQLEPTVISVWFEKKKGMDSKVIIASPVFGPQAQKVADALGSIDIATNMLVDDASLLHQLVLKNVYILTTNISGLKVGGNVGELWSEHREFATQVASDIVLLQEKLTGAKLNTEKLIDGMVEAFNGDLNHGCMGRSAPARLERALDLAEKNQLDLQTLKAIA